jgi:glycosyltransferase involved in cell wall biosynthesis
VRKRLAIVDDGDVLGGAQLALRHARAELELFAPTYFFLREGVQYAWYARSVANLPAALTTSSFSSKFVGSGIIPAAEVIRVVYAVAKLFKATRQHELLYANSLKASILCALLMRVSRRRQLIWHVRDVYDAEHFSSRVALTLIRTLIKHPRIQVVANSKYSALRIGRPSTVIYSPINPVFFARPVCCEPPGPIGVVMAGRLDPWKGQHILLQALRLPGLQDVSVVFAGSASVGHRDYEVRLRAAVEDQGLSDRVKFLGTVDDLCEVIDRSHIVVHATVTPEPFGQVVLQGMARSRPVVATSGGGIDELIEDGISGFTYAAGSVSQLHAILVRLVQDPALRTSTGQSAYERAAAFTSSAQLLKLRDFVSAVAERPVSA